MSEENKSGGSRFANAPEPDNDNNDEDNGKKKKVIIASVIAVIAVIVIAVVCFAVFRNNGGEAGSSETSIPIADVTIESTTTASETTTAETTTTVTETETTTTTTRLPLVMRDDIKASYDMNNDTVGHLTLNGTLINTDVVQGEDNSHYLETNFYGNYSAAGAVFADHRADINTYSDLQSDNITIYGHNQKDGTMFGTLQYYKIKKSDTSRFDFYKEHPTFTFSNLYETYTYKIVAIFISEADASQSKTGEIFDAHNYVNFSEDASDKRSFENFEKNINERTEVITGVDIQKGDKFMTLSTCSNEFDNSRLIVIGRRVRDNESSEVDTSKAVLNADVIEPDLNYIYYGV